MRITLTRRGDYAVRAMYDLAASHPRRRKAGEIAAAMDIPRTFLSRVLAGLARSGLLDAVAGPSGGYVLSRSPAEISLLEVVEAAEGKLALTECVLRGGPCAWEDTCAIHDTWVEAQQAFAARLADTSLEDLVGRPGAQ
jgi:Rrf2 family protein